MPLFQSALPLRGATKASENASCNAIFQSALPLRGATSSRPVRGTSYIFQSALPLRGATRESPRCTCCRGISIRAPLAGSDVESGFRFRSRDDFNPRSPCGERHRFFGSCEDIVIFQSALPLRGATATFCSINLLSAKCCIFKDRRRKFSRQTPQNNSEKRHNEVRTSLVEHERL